MSWECLVWDLDGTLVGPGSTAPVPGIGAVLTAQHRAGVRMAVATSAPTVPARALVRTLGWEELFDHVAGSGAGTVGKDDIVREALLGLGRPLPEGASGTAVIGDSPADMAAAVHLGLVAIGAAWSGASPGALGEAGAELVLDDPAALPPGPVHRS